ncbi:MAG TPA: helical backbone metal receptor [Gemmatimonadales bacterium]|jgi:iron complex transport system substrate-binding protein|nr:helical backbone metal receptor [Gemmatimonadales bacterium]
MGNLHFRRWCAAALLSIAACGSHDRGQRSTVKGGPSTVDRRLAVIDDAGDTIQLAQPARRVVSLIPATTELLFAIGAGDAVVGRTVWCEYPPEALAVPAVGDGMLPNIEAVVARQPDLVVLYLSSQNAQAAQKLRELGIAAVQVRTDRLADVPRVGRLLGKLTGHESGADSMARAFADSLKSATVPPQEHPTRAFVLVWADPPMTVGAGSYLSELVERAGGENIYRDLPASSGQISVESAVERGPDVVLVLGKSTPAFARRPEWQAVPAVREHRFVFADGSEFGQPSPRAPSAIRFLTTQFHALQAAGRGP